MNNFGSVLFLIWGETNQGNSCKNQVYEDSHGNRPWLDVELSLWS